MMGDDWTATQGCATWRSGPYPRFPKVYMGVESIGDEEHAFKGLLRHELLHALFEFLHPLRPGSVMDKHLGAYNDFTDRDKEMLRLYGAIPSGLSWDEIQRRACIGSGLLQALRVEGCSLVAVECYELNKPVNGR